MLAAPAKGAAARARDWSRLVLFPRCEAGDFVNVCAVDADVVQFTVGSSVESSCTTLQ